MDKLVTFKNRDLNAMVSKAAEAIAQASPSLPFMLAHMEKGKQCNEIRWKNMVKSRPLEQV